MTDDCNELGSMVGAYMYIISAMVFTAWSISLLSRADKRPSSRMNPVPYFHCLESQAIIASNLASKDII